MTKEHWARCWALLEAAYPNAKQVGNEATMEVHWMTLGAYWDHEVLRAVKEAIQGSKFFPAPAELLERIAGHRGRLGHDWATVEAKLRLEAAGKPIPAVVEGPDKSLEVLKGIPRVHEIGGSQPPAQEAR